MAFLKILIKFFIIIASVALMIAPAGAEVLSFRADKKKKISYKRLRSVLFTIVYLLVATIVMCFINSFAEWVKTASLTKWLIENFSATARKAYAAQVYSTIALNFLTGLVFVLIHKTVRIGNEQRNLTVPANANGEFSFFQKFERAAIRFFNTETWLFVGTVLKYFNIALFAAYGLAFATYQVPALFAAKWIPYKFISSLFEAGYVYPIITLLGTLEFYFFLEGMKMLGNECPEISVDTENQGIKTALCLDVIDAEVKKHFGNFHASDVMLTDTAGSKLSVSEHDIITENIGKAIENDKRNSHKIKEVYMNCVDRLVKTNNSILFNGSLFSEFSAYFLRYISIILARGDNVVFVCNSDLQTDDVYNYLNEGMAAVSSVYSVKETDGNFDNPIWKIVKIAEKHNAVNEACVDNASVLVTTLSYLCSDDFYTKHQEFINLIDTVVFVDSAETVNMFNRQMSILNTKLRHISKKNAVLSKNSKLNRMFKIRYTAKDIRYICFDNTRIPGLDKVLKNMLAVDFESRDATEYETSAVVRCYNYEAGCDENGNKVCPQFLDTEEKVDVIMNMAVLCLANGADSVDIFPEGVVPYGNIAETIASNLGQVLVNADGTNIRINKHRLNPERYHVILAMDSGNNLPAALRKYVSMASCAPALIIVFSKPYMLRDYYSQNISSIWHSHQIEKIPVEGGNKKNIAQKIIVKANAGGITKKEILRLASGDSAFDKAVANEDVNSVLRDVLKICNVSREDRIDLYKFFEYSSVREFNDEGECTKTDMISLRKNGNLFECINGRDMAKMVCGDSEFVLPVPRSRITQHFIEGQNLLYEGDVYNIQKLDTSSGRIYTRRAVGGKNEEAYQYVQKREYRVEIPADKTDFVYPMKHVVLNSVSENIEISDIYVSGMRVPVDVFTKGYYETDPYTCDVSVGNYKYYSISDKGDDYLAKQSYRRYGTLAKPAYSTEEIVRDTTLNASENGAVVMTLTMKGTFGQQKDKMVLLASVMLNELLRSMFPSVRDEIAVCPVADEDVLRSGEESALVKQPSLILTDEKGYLPKDNFSLLIIEDSNTELGVVSSLMAAGDDIVTNLFMPIFKYLEWYLNSENKSTYLYGGLKSEPECFDFVGLHEFCRLLGDGKHVLKFTEIVPAVEYFVCDFCGEKYEDANEITELKDGRKMCRKCANSIVGNDKKQTKQYLDRATAYLENTYGINADNDYTICFEETVKIINELEQNRDIARGNFDIPLKSFVENNGKIKVECSVPSVSLSELLVRELTYAWQIKNLPELEPELAEGLVALVAVQYLNFAREGAIASVRTVYYESTSNISGIGYRKLAGELSRNPKFKNNPFAYLVEICGKNSNDFMTALPVPPSEPTKFGNEYVPEVSDRDPDGNIEYFYYSRINENAKKAYDIICDAALLHLDRVQLDCPFEDISTALKSVWYDRPDIYWVKSLSVEQDYIVFEYAATAEEVAELNRRIELEVPKFLEGINNSMSAYDVTLRIHDRIMGHVDYDTVTLNRETEHPEDYVGIDYIRTICGVFLNGEAVCEGYARAVQYLLQKCGIECGEVAGTVYGNNGRPGGNHGWNIVKIDGEYYYLDTTWDDNSDTIQKVKRTDTGFSYFCVTTEEILRTRAIDLNPIDMPVCTATKANYYVHNNLLIEDYNLAQIKEFAVNAAKKNEQFFTFKCTTPQVYEKAVKELCVLGDDCYDIIKSASKFNKSILQGKYSFVNNDDIRTVSIYFKFQ